MKELDNELKIALRREEPPAGFAERVIERAVTSLEPGKPDRTHESIRLKPDPTYDAQTHNAQTHHRQRNDPRTWDPPLGGLMSRKSFLRWAAAAAVVVALAGGSLEYRARQRERAEGEAARERVVLALHIASSKLQLVQTKIARMHQQPENNSTQ